MAGTTTTQGAVIDYLFQLAGSLGLQDVQIADGAVNQYIANDALIIGSMTAPTADGVMDWAAISSAREQQEDYVVLCMIRSWRGGADDNYVPGQASALKPARDAALGVFTAFRNALMNDLNLANLNGGVALVDQPVLISNLAMDETTEQVAAEGRAVQLDFSIRIQNRIGKAPNGVSH